MRVYTSAEAIEYQVEYGQINDRNELTEAEATEAGEKALRAALKAGEWVGVVGGYVCIGALSYSELAGLYERGELEGVTMTRRELVAHYVGEPWSEQAVAGAEEGITLGYETALKNWSELCVSDGQLYTGGL